jgi:general secretion pathway protein A
MYYEFFGLRESAFSIAVNPRYLYMSDQHREALAYLLYGVQNGGFVMLTGEVGTGKTTLVRRLLEQLPENMDLAIILNPMASAPELLASICDELNVSYIEDDLTLKYLTDSLNIFLLKNHAQGRKTVLLIDEAQLLQIPVLEQIRLLTNLETNTEKLLQIILVGQPELKDLLSNPELRQLSQRITARFHLNALNLEETQGYLAHRLKVAGMSSALPIPFPLDIIKLLHKHSGGIPRLINVISERLLIGAYSQQKSIVDIAIFNQAIQEVTGTKPVVKKSNKKALKAIYQGVAVIFILAFIVFLTRSQEFFNHKQPPVVIASSSVSSAATSSVSSTSESSSSASQSVMSKDYVNFLMEKTRAESFLMNMAGETVFDINLPCGVQIGQNFRCQRDQLSTWNQLKELNRPGLLTLVDENKKAFYLLVIGLNPDQLLVRNQQQEKIIEWNDIVNAWNGEFTFVWSSPVGFDTDLQVGDHSSVVSWVAEQFAAIDNQNEPLTRLTFTDNLKRRIALFQASRGLEANGVINRTTIQHLNLLQGIDKSLISLPAKPVSEMTLSSARGGN